MSTPSGLEEAAPRNISDCNVATMIAARLSKPVIWAALGDSYSAGVGGPVNGSQYGQDIVNSFAWAAASQFHNEADDAYVGVKLTACSGAVVKNIFRENSAAPGVQLTREQLPQQTYMPDGYWRKLPDALQTLRDATIVTLTVGGNDAGFGNLATSVLPDRGCLNRRPCTLIADGGIANDDRDGRDPSLRIDEGPPATEWAEMRRRLVNAYEVTRALMPPEARLFIVQYPIPFAEPTARCGAATVFGPRNMALVNRFAAQLNATIADAAAEASTSTSRPIHVVPWGGEDQHLSTKFDHATPTLFSRNGLCSAQPWVNDAGPRVRGRTLEDSFHPSTHGAIAAGCATARSVFEHQELVRLNGYRLKPDTRCPG